MQISSPVIVVQMHGAKIFRFYFTEKLFGRNTDNRRMTAVEAKYKILFVNPAQKAVHFFGILGRTEKIFGGYFYIINRIFSIR